MSCTIHWNCSSANVATKLNTTMHTTVHHQNLNFRLAPALLLLKKAIMLNFTSHRHKKNMHVTIACPRSKVEVALVREADAASTPARTASSAYNVLAQSVQRMAWTTSAAQEKMRRPSSRKRRREYRMRTTTRAMRKNSDRATDTQVMLYHNSQSQFNQKHTSGLELN